MSYDTIRPLQLPDKIRVCVLTSSYQGSDSELKEFEEEYPMNPAYYFDKDDPVYEFTLVSLRKATVFREVRNLAKSGRFDVFFNLCDGAEDEDRAGEEVVRALEKFQVPFTASISKFYELSKPDMKMMAYYGGIPTAAYAVLETDDHATIREQCAHLRFPVIVKHISGYSSVGMTKDCKCITMEDLVPRAAKFVNDYQFALVEEFIIGDEVTVLACADSTQPSGVRVYHPVQVRFPAGSDFKDFDLKWKAFDGMEWALVKDDDPALEQMVGVTRRSFKEMMGGVGYGRCDLRINRERNEVVFLEINPNCGIMYPPGQEGSADWILKHSPGTNAGQGKGPGGQRDFAILQIKEAMLKHHREKPLFDHAFHQSRGFYLKAACDIPVGAVVMADEGRSFRLFTKPYVAANWTSEEVNYFRQSSWPVGSDEHYYAVWDLLPSCWRSFNHSCEPNMAFAPEKSLNIIARLPIKAGDELTMDYRTFMDCLMYPFDCNCGSENCGKHIAIPNRYPSMSVTPNNDNFPMGMSAYSRSSLPVSPTQMSSTSNNGGSNGALVNEIILTRTASFLANAKPPLAASTSMDS